MHTSKGTTQGYNTQALADASHQVIVTASVPEGGQDGRVLGPLFEEATRITEASGMGKEVFKGKELLADANYHSEVNLEVVAAHQLDAVIPDPNYRDRDKRYEGREKHIRKARPQEVKRFTKEHFPYDESSDTYTCPAGKTLKLYQRQNKNDRGIYRRYRISGAPCESCEFKEKCLSKRAKKRTLSILVESANPHCQKMRDLIDTAEAKERYSYRMGSIEPIFANIRHAKNITRINYRGRQKVDLIWKLTCIMHNITRLNYYRPEYGC